MNRVMPILLVAAALPASALGVEWGLPWFHTRPKPVFLDDGTSQQVAKKSVKRADYRETGYETTHAVWTDSERSRDSVSRSEGGSKSSGTAHVFTRPAR
jgi:hypothetical protein